MGEPGRRLCSWSRMGDGRVISEDREVASKHVSCGALVVVPTKDSDILDKLVVMEIGNN